jgi:hypothetical protein
MISTVFSIIFAIIFSVGVLLIIKFNGNPSRLTIRGLRVLFIGMLPVGFLLAQFAINFYWFCGADSCHVGWGM